MPRTVKQNKQIRENQTSLILEAAIKLFSKKGYYGTSTSMIAKEAGMSKGLLYHYFESKESIVIRIFQAGSNLRNSGIDEDPDEKFTPKAFEAYIRSQFDALKKHTPYFKLLYALTSNDAVMKILKSQHALLRLSPKNEKIYAYFKEKFEDYDHQFFVFASLIKGSTLIYCLDSEFLNNKRLDSICEEVIARFV